MNAIALIVAWPAVMAYVIIGNYVYFTKIPPALARDGLDGSMKFTTSGQLEQVDLFLARLAPGAPRPWFFGLLAHIRIVTAVVAALAALAVVATALEVG